jgi:hypothetical protein
MTLQDASVQRLDDFVDFVVKISRSGRVGYGEVHQCVTERVCGLLLYDGGL